MAPSDTHVRQLCERADVNGDAVMLPIGASEIAGTVKSDFRWVQGVSPGGVRGSAPRGKIEVLRRK